MKLNRKESGMLIQALDTEMGIVAKSILKNENLIATSSEHETTAYLSKVNLTERNYFKELLTLQTKLKSKLKGGKHHA